MKLMIRICCMSSILLASCWCARDLSAGLRLARHKEVNEASHGTTDVTATEDLMREHGVLSRLLLIYEKYTHRIRKQQVIDIPVLRKTVLLVQSFIQNYHEKLEEDYVFPIFERHKKQTKLTQTLRTQHEKGRLITQRLLAITDPAAGRTKVQMHAMYHEIKNLLKDFIIMYRPHAAREDTVLFPQLRSLISDDEFEKLGESFETKEHALFGKQGFEGIVKQVAQLEQELELYELDQFTPER